MIILYLLLFFITPHIRTRDAALLVLFQPNELFLAAAANH